MKTNADLSSTPSPFAQTSASAFPPPHAESAATKNASPAMLRRLNEAPSLRVLEPPHPDQVGGDDVRANSAVGLTADVPTTAQVGAEDRRIGGRRANGESRNRVARARVTAVVRAAGYRPAHPTRAKPGMGGHIGGAKSCLHVRCRNEVLAHPAVPAREDRCCERSGCDRDDGQSLNTT